ncbi:nucleoside-diphosphate kinase [Streptomyces nojiriensis]|uniref:nucleoside-diphosphate kinase n=1 Tax=Streptomyces nojiriensis TaxID=66374 RepID=UPI0036DA9E1F
MTELNRLALLVVTPDGVVQHLTRLITGWMRDQGYRLRGFRELHLSPEQQTLLNTNSKTGGPKDWELNSVIYTLGPVHALLLEQESDRCTFTPSAASELAEQLIGDFLPHRTVPGTLRRDFGALSPVFNLVHATGNSENLDRDARSLFDRPLDELLRPDSDTSFGLARTPHLLRPLKLWSTVAGVLTSWLGPEVVRPIDWPADSHGPSHPAVGAALMACTRAAQRAGGEPGALLNGVLDGSTTYPDFTRLVPHIDPWPGYLTYTTLRHVTLSADTP